METVISHSYMIHFRNSRNNACRTAVVPRVGETEESVLDRALGEAKNLSGEVSVVRNDGELVWERGRAIEDGGMVHGL